MNELTATTNASPYIFAAYILGFICIYGFSGWLYLKRLRVERFLTVLNKDKP